MEQPDFIQIPTQLLCDNKLQPSDRIVYGYIYWLEKLKDGRCVASNQTLAKLAGITPGGVQNALNRLEAYGYIKRLFRDEAKKLRSEIKALIVYGVSSNKTEVSSNDGTVSSNDDKVSSNDDQNNNSIIIAAEKEVGTSVPTQAIEYGNPDINQLFSCFEEEFGFKPTGNARMNRFAAKRLIQKVGLESAKVAVRVARSVKEEPYAPQVFSIVDLEQKIPKLKEFVRKRSHEANLGVIQ